MHLQRQETTIKSFYASGVTIVPILQISIMKMVLFGGKEEVYELIILILLYYAVLLIVAGIVSAVPVAEEEADRLIWAWTDCKTQTEMSELCCQ